MPSQTLTSGRYGTTRRKHSVENRPIKGQDAGDAFQFAAIRQLEADLEQETIWPEIENWIQSGKPDRDASEAYGDLPFFPDEEAQPNVASQGPQEAGDGVSSPVVASQDAGGQGADGGAPGTVSGIGQSIGEPRQESQQPAAEPGADNRPQLVIPGAEQDVRGAIRNAAKAPLRSKAPQKGMDVGMFGSERDQTDIFDQPKPKAEQPADAAAPVPGFTPDQQQAMPSYGSSNTFVTKDRAAELREKIKAKLRNQLSSGIDPEMLALGAELAAYHIEAGARRFSDVARAISADLGVSIQQIRPYLRSWYNGARDMMEDAGLDVAGMDSPDEVKAALTALTEEKTNNGHGNGIRQEAQGVSAASQSKPVQEPEPERAAGGALQDGGDAGGGNVRNAERSDANVKGPAKRVLAKGSGSGSNSDNRGRDRAARGGAGPAAESANVTREVRKLEEDRAAKRALNYRIVPEDRIGQGGPKEKVATNIEAIRTLKAILEDKRQATPDEKRAIVRYVGWGAFAQDVFAKHKPEWAKERAALADLLSAEEFASARASTLNAHYTSESVIKGMWSAMDHLGFTGGRALEPSAGVGHFIGLTPREIMEKSALT